MTDRIIEIAETGAYLSMENQLLKLRFLKLPEMSIPVSEIQCLILANPAVTITGALLAALAEAGCMVLVSGANRLPVSMLLPLVGNYIQTERFIAQTNAGKPLIKRLWQTVVQEKIRRQRGVLLDLHMQDFGLGVLIKKVVSGDTGNVEGQAAKIYWKHFFDTAFVRSRDLNDNNILLNYGYAILRAMTARACCLAGLHPTLGINHHNRYNPYCLADDLMEPFRPLVDKQVFLMNPNNLPIPLLSQNMRSTLISALLVRIKTGTGERTVTDLLRMSAVRLAESFQKNELLLKYD